MNKAIVGWSKSNCPFLTPPILVRNDCKIKISRLMRQTNIRYVCKQKEIALLNADTDYSIKVYAHGVVLIMLRYDFI